jgi:hypothetical protein
MAPLIFNFGSKTEVMVSFTPGGALVLIEQEAKLVWTSRKEKSVLLLPEFESRIVQPLACSVY